jgi:CYTH domain-containing protein
MTMNRIGKYACLEIERRYLLRKLPEGLRVQSAGWRIFDRYIAGTRLRLRRMEPLNGDPVAYKLGQKYRSDSQGPAETTMTNFYLDRAEYDRLIRLDGRDLTKTRYPFRYRDLLYGIDVFEGNLEGLVLAEIECESLDDFENLALPPAGWIDVTENASFTGGHLAGLPREVFEATILPLMEGASHCDFRYPRPSRNDE